MSRNSAATAATAIKTLDDTPDALLATAVLALPLGPPSSCVCVVVAKSLPDAIVTFCEMVVVGTKFDNVDSVLLVAFGGGGVGVVPSVGNVSVTVVVNANAGGRSHLRRDEQTKTKSKQLLRCAKNCLF